MALVTRRPWLFIENRPSNLAFIQGFMQSIIFLTPFMRGGDLYCMCARELCTCGGQPAGIFLTFSVCPQMEQVVRLGGRRLYSLGFLAGSVSRFV